MKTSTLHLPFSFTAFTASSVIGVLGWGKGRGCCTLGLNHKDRAAWQVLRKQILQCTGEDLSTRREGSVKEVGFAATPLSLVLDFLVAAALAQEPMEKNSKS